MNHLPLPLDSQSASKHSSSPTLATSFLKYTAKVEEEAEEEPIEDDNPRALHPEAAYPTPQTTARRGHSCHSQ